MVHGACLRAGKPSPSDALQKELADELRAKVQNELNFILLVLKFSLQLTLYFFVSIVPFAFFFFQKNCFLLSSQRISYIKHYMYEQVADEFIKRRADTEW